MYSPQITNEKNNKFKTTVIKCEDTQEEEEEEEEEEEGKCKMFFFNLSPVLIGADVTAPAVRRRRVVDGNDAAVLAAPDLDQPVELLKLPHRRVLPESPAAAAARRLVGRACVRRACLVEVT